MAYPELLADPGYIISAEGNSMVLKRTLYGVRGKDVIIVHVILVTVVVVLDVRLAIMRGVDVELAIKDMGAGISGKEVAHDGAWIRHVCC